MTIDESAVAQHYGKAGLLARIDAGLNAMGADLDHLTIDDLAPVDEFHIGGRKATDHALDALAPAAGQHILDVGCGIGGTARLMASRYGCRVHGIDLTPEYVDIARILTERVGLGDQVSFDVASALAMPFEDQAFDGAVTMHVAMNIADREGLYGEIARVLKPGAAFCVYDVMKMDDQPLVYPVPWADTAATSHLTTADQTRALLECAGFEVTLVDDRSDAAATFFRKRLAAADEGPPPLGVYLLMGATWRDKLNNNLANTGNGRTGPVLMMARRGA
jgi:SAM-dependent methyltransferase